MWDIQDGLYRERWDCFDNPGIKYLPTHDFSGSWEKPIIIVTQGGDFGVEYDKDDFFHWRIRTQGHTNKEFSELDSSIIKWFSTNMSVDDSRCGILPLGLVNESCLEDINNNLGNVKDGLIYCNFKTYSNEVNRKQVLEDCKKTNICTIEQELSHSEYYERLSSFKYAICPTGNGLDSYRIWECFYLGVIPILQESVFSRLLSKDFPLISVQSYLELSDEFLLKQSSILSQVVPEKLTKSYWINYIESLV